MLPSKLRFRLIDVLRKVPRCAMRPGRDTLLSYLSANLVDSLQRSDAAAIDLDLIQSQLDKMGRLTSTSERPLLIILEPAARDVEGTETGRELTGVIRDLEIHYGSGEVDTSAPMLRTAEPKLTPVKVPEAIVFCDERVSFSFVQRAFDAARSVTRLAVPYLINGKPAPRPSVGTAWLITPGLLLTNHHVITPRSADPTDVITPLVGAKPPTAAAWFDYWAERQNTVADVVEVAHKNDAFDYAILRLRTPTDRPPLVVAPTQPSLLPGDRLNIIQHPGGGPLKYAMRNNHYVGTAGNGQEYLLRYLTDTDAGASGAPVLDDMWRVVALHHAWTEVEPQTHHGQTVFVNNEGIAIHTILADLPPALRAEIESAQNWKIDVTQS